MAAAASSSGGGGGGDVAKPSRAAPPAASTVPSPDLSHRTNPNSPALSSDSLPEDTNTSSPSGSASAGEQDTVLLGGVPLNTITTAASVVVALLAIRGGLFNLLLVVTMAGVLLMNPYVRTFLDLRTLSQLDGSDLGALDPAKYFTFTQRKAAGAAGSPVTAPEDEGETGALRQVTRPSSFEPLPDHIQQSMDQLVPLVVRDFVQGWYTHHSFGHPNFPTAARSTIEYMAGSIWTRALQRRLNSVEVANELLLTGSSVFLTCLRRKRYANHAAAAGDRMAAKAAMRGGTGHWNSNEERIASLRSGMRAFFERHLPQTETGSALVFPLVTEILTKQLWNLLLTVGEPDFLNRNLVGWKEKQVAAAATANPNGPSTTSNAGVPSSQQQPTTPSRPASRASGAQQPPQASASASGNAITPPTTAPRPTSAAAAPAPPALPDRPPSVPPRHSTSVASPFPAPSPSASPSPADRPPLVIPDRGMISTPPSRSDSPMMPSFASRSGAAGAAGNAPGLAPQRVLSPARASLDNAMRPPSPMYGYSQRAPPKRTSTEFSDGFSAVVGGLGSVIKGVGKGADAIVGGVGDVLTSSGGGNGQTTNAAVHPDAYERRNGNPSSTMRMGSPPPSLTTAPRRTPSIVERPPPSMSPDQNNASIRRKHPAKKENDLTDLMASQAAWPSNLPRGLDKSAEGEHLPPSLAAGLKRPSGSNGNSSNDIGASLRGPQPPPRASPHASPPRMTTSLPYEISPRSSIDGPQGVGGSTSGHRSSNANANANAIPPSPSPLGGSRAGGGASSAGPSSRPTLPPRPHPNMSSLPPAPALSSVLSRSDPHNLYDSFEAFLESSHPSLVSISIPGEGEELLRLQVGLGTIERLVPRDAGEEAEMFREDASTIMAKARDGLERASSRARSINDSDSRLRSVKAIIRKLNDAVAQLGFGPEGFEVKQGTVRDALEPVRLESTWRLQKLFGLFWSVHNQQQQGAVQSQSQQQPQRAFSPSPSMQPGLSYEPRKGGRGAGGGAAGGDGGVAAVTPASAAASTPVTPPNTLPTTGSTPSSLKRTSLQAPKPRQAILDHFINLNDDDDDDDDVDAFNGQPHAHTALNVAVTDISPNADRPDAPVDLRTFEFICAVEGGGSGSDLDGGGYVLVRTWPEVVTLEKDLRRRNGSTGNSSSNNGYNVINSVAIPPLPTTKGRTSAMLSAELEQFLAAVLGTPELANTPPVAQFADRTRAGTSAAAAAARTGFNPFASGVELGRTLGKNLVDGVGAVGKAAATATTRGAAGAANATAMRTSLDTHAPPASNGATTHDNASAAANTAPLSTDSAVKGLIDSTTTTTTGPTAGKTQRPRGLSARALDAILTSIFALADEALSLTGAWSMRRGVVRLLQSVVRQSYSSSIISAFDGVSSSLSSKSVSTGLDFIRTTFWADGPDAKWTHVKGPPRSARDRIESEEKAREIVKAYAPTQAAFVLGPGGKQACEKALEAVHGVICDDEGALDLALTLTLRLLQIL